MRKSIAIKEIYFFNKKNGIFMPFFDNFLLFLRFYLLKFSIASAVCDKRDAIVIGPTPPGTGV